MNPYAKYSGNELLNVEQVLLGLATDPVGDFERAFAKKIGGKYAIAVNSGTSALHAALVACNVRDRDVLTTALAPAMVTFAIIHAGGRPIFCDVDAATHHISRAEVESKLTVNTAAILGVSLHGLPIDWEPFLSLRESHTLYLIDDCAQALGAKDIGKADITCFSFEDKKHLTTGSEGGMILTDNSDLATAARKFAGLGYKHMTAEAGRTSLAAETYQNPEYERFDTIGLNYRMSRVQAAIGLGQLEYLDHIIARRRAVARLYAESLVWVGVSPLPYIENSSYYTWPGAFLAPAQAPTWLQFYKLFKANGGDGFYAMPQVSYKEPALHKLFPDVSCPIAEDLQRCLMLFKTNYRDLGEAERQATILRQTLQQLGESK